MRNKSWYWSGYTCNNCGEPFLQRNLSSNFGIIKTICLNCFYVSLSDDNTKRETSPRPFSDLLDASKTKLIRKP